MKDFPFIDLRAIARRVMEKYGFTPRFPQEVLREVAAVAGKSLPDTVGYARDLRALLWSSIDNFDSQDLDQLEYCEPITNGEIRVMIAIADVDDYVPIGSEADLYAAHNGTSVYTGIETFPLLPDRLSKGVTSLLPGQDRLAIVIRFTVKTDGSVNHEGVERALVRNKAKLVYEEVGNWLEGTSALPASVSRIPGLEAQIRLQHLAAGKLRTYRMAHGALDLDTLEASPVIEGVTVKELVIQEQNQARALIEDFMVAANRTMIAFLENAGLPVIERIVRTPRNWEGIRMMAAARGETLPYSPDASALSQFLVRQKAADLDRFPDLSLSVVKLMGPGEYIMLEPGGDATGHFALAVTDYTHATAPNRRYVDLINQRQVKSVLAGKMSPYTPRELEEYAAHLTDREKASKKVERFMRKAAAAILLRHRIGETFDALVTGAADKGTYVRLINPPAEGRVIRHERGLRIGQNVRVQLLSADPYNGFIDFAYVGEK